MAAIFAWVIPLLVLTVGIIAAVKRRLGVLLVTLGAALGLLLVMLIAAVFIPSECTEAQLGTDADCATY